MSYNKSFMPRQHCAVLDHSGSKVALCNESFRIPSALSLKHQMEIIISEWFKACYYLRLLHDCPHSFNIKVLLFLG